MKVLIISGNPFSKYLNNGKTYEAIFSSFEKKEICQLFVRPVDLSLIDFDYCNSYYCISDWDIINKLTFKQKECGKIITKDNAISLKDQNLYYNKVHAKSGLSKSGLLGIARDVVWSTGVWKNKQLKQWLDAEAPDVIFVDGGGDCYIYSICLYIHKYLNIPIVYYVTDDYLLYIERKSICQFIHHYFLNNIIRTIVKKSILCYAIGEIMAREYTNFFKKEFEFIMNSVDILPFSPKEMRKSNKLTISYFGSLGLNRGNMIVRIGELLHGKFNINVYSFAIADSLLEKFHELGINYAGSVKDKEFEDAIKQSDFLLHVESDKEQDRKFTKLAISTKIPEYLMHSRLIIAYGPPEIASIKLIKDNNIGLYINSTESYAENIRFIDKLHDENFVNTIILQAYSFAVSNFDKTINSKKIRDNFIRVLRLTNEDVYISKD